MFEAPNEKVVIDVVLKRLDRMEIETLVAVPANEASPAGKGLNINNCQLTMPGDLNSVRSMTSIMSPVFTILSPIGI